VAVGYGTFQSTATWTATPLTISVNLTGVAGLWVGVIQVGGVTDEAGTLTIGASTISRTSGASATQQVNGAGGSVGRVYSFLIGTGLPSGTQTLAITQSGSTLKQMGVCAITAAQDVEEAAVNGLSSTNVTNPTLSLAPGAGVTTVSFSAAHIADFIGGHTPGTGCTDLLAVGDGSHTKAWERRTSVDTTSPFTHGWNYNNDDICAVAVAVKESAVPADNTTRLAVAGMFSPDLLPGMWH